MQIEGMIMSIRSAGRVTTVLSGGAHIVDSSEARVDGGLAARAGVHGVFGETLAGVILFEGGAGGAAGGADCWAGRAGGGVGAGRGSD